MKHSYLKAMIHISLNADFARIPLDSIYVDKLNDSPVFVATNGKQLLVCKEEAAVQIISELKSSHDLTFKEDYNYYDLIKIKKKGISVDKKKEYPKYREIIPNKYSNPKEIPHAGDWSNLLKIQQHIEGYKDRLYYPQYWNGPREAMVSLYENSSVLFLVMPFCQDIKDSCGVQTELNFFKEVKSEKKFWRKKKHE